MAKRDISVRDLPLDDHLCFSLYSASLAVTRLYKPMLDAMGITYPQYLVLKALSDDGRGTVGGLARRLGLEASTITPLVKRLETAGLVDRTRGEKDERIVEVALTDRGRGVVAGSGCLAEALVGRSEMTPDDLMALKNEVTTLRRRLAA